MIVRISLPAHGCTPRTVHRGELDGFTFTLQATVCHLQILVVDRSPRRMPGSRDC